MEIEVSNKTSNKNLNVNFNLSNRIGNLASQRLYLMANCSKTLSDTLAIKQILDGRSSEISNIQQKPKVNFSSPLKFIDDIIKKPRNMKIEDKLLRA